MFKAVANESLPPGISLLLRGSKFAYWDIPQDFTVTNNLIKSPLTVSVVFRREQDKKLILRQTDIINNRVTVEIVNPHVIEPAAIIGRRELAVLNHPEHGSRLTFSLMVFNPDESGYVFFHYEFYEEPLQLAQKEIPTESSEAKA